MPVFPHYQVAIVGAGFCGTMVAVNLARLAPGMAIALIERNPVAGPGLAYGTGDGDHLLNVRAGQMGAFAGDAGHFWRWLETQPDFAAGLSASSFAPRLIYGRYLRQILLESCADHPKLNLLRRHIVDIRSSAAGFDVIDADGQALTAERVVLALGTFPPDPAVSNADALNPYMPATWDELARPGDVLIVGSGLTSLDLVVTLAKTKASGVIHLLSRHGLLPREHIDAPLYSLLVEPPYPRTALELLRKMRREIAQAGDVPWQSVVDAFRPLNQKLWQALDLNEQRRFLRHLRSYWDAHRHRCAPQVMDSCRALQQAGRLVLHRGSIVGQSRTADGWDIAWRPRGKADDEKLSVRQMARCTGPQADLRKLDDALVQNLMRGGMIAADALALGISASGYVVCDATGKPVEGFYTLGSLLKGQLYESVAVPELRGQAADVASLIAREI